MMLPYEVVEVWWFCITFFLYFRAATLWGYGLGSAPAPSQVNASWISSSTTTVVVQFCVETGKCDGTHPRQLQRDLHTSPFAKGSSLLSI